MLDRTDGAVIISDPEIYRGEISFQIPDRRDREVIGLLISQQGATCRIADIKDAMKEVLGIKVGVKSIEYSVGVTRSLLRDLGSGVLFKRRDPSKLIQTVASNTGSGVLDRGYMVAEPPEPFKARLPCWARPK